MYPIIMIINLFTTMNKGWSTSCYSVDTCTLYIIRDYLNFLESNVLRDWWIYFENSWIFKLRNQTKSYYIWSRCLFIILHGNNLSELKIHRLNCNKTLEITLKYKSVLCSNPVIAVPHSTGGVQELKIWNKIETINGNYFSGTKNEK